LLAWTNAAFLAARCFSSFFAAAASSFVCACRAVFISIRVLNQISAGAVASQKIMRVEIVSDVGRDGAARPLVVQL
jgi:hypothetical protein